MTVEIFAARLQRAQVSDQDRDWMPFWMREFMEGKEGDSDRMPAVDEVGVLHFLRSLRDRGAPAWQRLQAARALEWYQELVLKTKTVDFGRFKLKLGELAAREKLNDDQSVV